MAFTDNSLHAKAWNWTFGINGSDTTQNPTRFYYDPGEYPVNLTITDSLGCTDTITKILEVVDIVGIEDPFDIYFKMYPNPVGNILNLTKGSKKPAISELKIYDHNGSGKAL